MAAEGRAFALTPKYPSQARGDGVSLVAEPEFKLQSENSAHTVTVRPFYRLDPIDDHRSHADLREGSYKFSKGVFDASAGVGTFAWGVLESYRPTDVINQLDFVEGPNSNAKLGQPFAELGLSSEHVTARVYALPYFRDRTFPGTRGRLRFPVAVDTDSPEFDTKYRRFEPSGAARVTIDLGDADIGIGLFTGLSREPSFVAELTTGSVVPRYQPIHQGSVDFQWALGPFVLKAETFARMWRGTDVYFGGGAGADVMLAHVFKSGELTLAAEFLFDTRPIDAPVTFFEHDAFGGLRLAFEDEASTEISAGDIVDVVDGTTFGHFEASRRFGDHWRLGLEGNVFFASSKKLEGGFARDHYGLARLAYHF